MQNQKKRLQIMEEAELDSSKRIYIEKKKKDLIEKRYSKWELKLNSSYIYEKMQKLLDQRIYLETWNIPRDYVYAQWFLNVFDLHKKLDEIIKKEHLPKRNQKIYTKSEQMYMDKFIIDRKIGNYCNIF